MRRLWLIVLFVTLDTSISSGQQSSPFGTPKLMDALPGPVRVYAAGPGVTAPELLPYNFPITGIEKCKKKIDGEVTLSVIVDATGRPRNLLFLHPLGTDLDRFALQIAAADRFNPGTSDGAPVAVGQSLEISLQACAEETGESTGKKLYSLRMRSLLAQKLGSLPQTPEIAVLTTDDSWKIPKTATPPIYRVGGSVSAPVPLTSPEARYTPEAKKAKINGKCLVSLIVDRHGLPQNIQIAKSLDPGLDQNAMDAIARYRFKPAMRNGEPVPVMVNVEVNFRLY